MTMANADHDQAGQAYWNRAWDATPLPALWRVDSLKLGDHVDRSFFAYMSAAFRRHGLVDQSKLLIEAGCARSAVLPLFATKLGFRVAGLDYSPNGCEQTRLMLEREDVKGETYCHDVFSLPNELVERFDVVVSFGLIEHFSDTREVVTALARLIKPGGLIFTNIPNMRGMTGFVQRMMDRRVYEIHVPLTAKAVCDAHRQAGLEVLACDYFLPTNFGVVNLNSLRVHSLQWWAKKAIMAVMVRMSMAVWWLERVLGRLPTSRLFSPYVNCLAMKPK